MPAPMLEAALSPRSVAVIGASDNPHKVGGRPILYMQRYGFRGAIYPINPVRSSVQGLRAFAWLHDLPEVPELAIVAVGGDEAVRAVQDCTLVRGKGLGVRHVHATGNEADVTVADLAAAVIDDPGVRLLLLYMEAIADAQGLATAAEAARAKGIPIVALKAGRTARGQKAASSHTGALASEDRVVDAFFERHAIWRAADPHELVSAAALYLSGRRPRGRRLVFVSNSGASCVTAADYAEEKKIPLAAVSPQALFSAAPSSWARCCPSSGRTRKAISLCSRCRWPGRATTCRALRTN